jgi:uncharacterized DUF497 family protein
LSRFSWDDEKRLKNLAKHGLDFADVPLMDWASATILEDVRANYGERRYWAFATWDARLHLVAFALRGEKIRVISFRRASRKEVGRYGKP